VNVNFLYDDIVDVQ